MKQSYIHDRRDANEEDSAFRARKILHPVMGFLTGRVLDVGCSDGSFMAELQRAGRSPVGVDLGADLVEACIRRGLEAHNINAADGLPFPDGAFDSLLMSHVLEHVYDPFSLLVECHRVLRPDGNIVVVVPNALNLRETGFMRGHVNYYDPENVYYVLRAAGFDPRYIGTDFPLASRFSANVPMTPGNWADRRQRVLLRLLPTFHLGLNLYAVGRRAENAGPGGARDARGAVEEGETAYGAA